MYCDAYTFAVTQIGVLSMTFPPLANRADGRHHRHARKLARSCRELKYPDRRNHAAVRALHAAISAPSLKPDASRRERRVYSYDLCTEWHRASKAARA